MTKQFPNLPERSYLVRYAVVAQVMEAGAAARLPLRGADHAESAVVGTAGTSTTSRGHAATRTPYYAQRLGRGRRHGGGSTFTCTGPGAFDVLDGSQAAFIRLNHSQVQRAVTTVP